MKTGALATLPQCPPFPDLTAFERTVLDVLARTLDEDMDSFEAQVRAARVVGRINTIVGFYTDIEIDRSSCSPLSRSYNTIGVFCEFDRIPHGLGVILWFEAGYLRCLEGWTVDEDPLKGVDLATLNPKSIVVQDSVPRSNDA